jgi:membrane protease YdiL (CAAX protease family)
MAAGLAMVFFVLGGFLLSQITGMSLLEMGDPSSWDMKDNRVITMLRGLMLLQFLGLFFVPSLLFGYFSDPQPMRYLGLRVPNKAIYWIIAIAILILAIPMVEYTGQLNRQFPFGESTLKWITQMEEEAARTLQFLLGRSAPVDLVMNIIFIAAFAAVGEELVFRGILQRLLIRGLKNPWAGIILSAFLFSFFHMQFFGFLPRLLLGILLGALYWYSGSLWTAILAHFVYDAFFITLAWYYPKMISDPQATVIDQSSQLVMALVSAALVGLLLWLMKKNSTADYQQIYASDIEEDNKT